MFDVLTLYLCFTTAHIGMPIKGNQFRSNNFKEENTPRPNTAKGETERPSKLKAEKMPAFNLNDGRLVKIIGLFFTLFSLYLLTAFTSYLFTWQQDQSYVSPANGGWHNLFKGQQELIDNGVKNPVVENWLGKFGALLSNQFIYQWFGVASFIFVAIFFIIGYRLLFKVKLYSLNKTFGYGLFGIVFISIALGFVHGFIIDYPHFLEGEFGYWSNLLLGAQIGQMGTAGLLVFAGLTALIIAYNIDFKLPERKERFVEPMMVDEVAPEPVELVDEELSFLLNGPGMPTI